MPCVSGVLATKREILKKRLNWMRKAYIKKEYSLATTLHYLSANPLTTDSTWPDYLQRQNGSFHKLSRELQRRNYCSFEEKTGYRLRERGNKYLKQQSDYIAFFNFACPYADILDYVKVQHTIKNKSFETVMISLLKSKVAECIAHESYDDAVNIYVDLASLYERKGQAPRALMYYLRALLLEVSGVLYKPVLDSVSAGSLSATEARQQLVGIIVSPEIRRSIAFLSEFYEYDMVEYLLEQDNYPVNVFSADMLDALVMEIIYGNYDPLQWQNILSNKYQLLLKSSAASGTG